MEQNTMISPDRSQTGRAPSSPSIFLKAARAGTAKGLAIAKAQSAVLERAIQREKEAILLRKTYYEAILGERASVIERLTAENKEISDRAATELTQRMKSMREQYEKQRIESSEEMLAMKHANRIFEQTIEKLRNENTRLENNVKEEQTTSSKMSGKYLTLRTREAEMSEENRKLKAREMELSKENQNLKNREIELSKECRKLKAREVELSTENKNLKIELSKENKHLKAREVQLSAEKQQLKVMTKEVEMCDSREKRSVEVPSCSKHDQKERGSENASDKNSSVEGKESDEIPKQSNERKSRKRRLPSRVNPPRSAKQESSPRSPKTEAKMDTLQPDGIEKKKGREKSEGKKESGKVPHFARQCGQRREKSNRRQEDTSKVVVIDEEIDEEKETAPQFPARKRKKPNSEEVEGAETFPIDRRSFLVGPSGRTPIRMRLRSYRK